MKNGNIKLDLGSITAGFSTLLKQLRAYRALILFLVVASLYGFILWRINVYSNVPANQTASTGQTAAAPRVDQATVQKILTLQDNSVNVQALFNQARQNPFQE